jgi:hypothetical protein
VVKRFLRHFSLSDATDAPRMDAKTKPLSPKHASFESAALASLSRLSASLQEECHDGLIRF